MKLKLLSIVGSTRVICAGRAQTPTGKMWTLGWEQLPASAVLYIYRHLCLQ